MSRWTGRQRKPRTRNPNPNARPRRPIDYRVMMTADWPDPEVVSKLRGGEREDDRVIIQRDGRIGLVAVIVWVTAPTPPADAIEVGLRVWRRLWAHAYGASPAEMRVKVTRQTEQEERDRIERKWKRQQEKRRKEGRNSGHRKP